MKRLSRVSTSYQLLAIPDANSTPTLIMPTIENLCSAIAVAAAQRGSFCCEAAASSIASGGKPPSQKPAASKCSASVARGNSPAAPGVAPACPVQAGPISTIIARMTVPVRHAARAVERSNAGNEAARRAAADSRASDT